MRTLNFRATGTENSVLFLVGTSVVLGAVGGFVGFLLSTWLSATPHGLFGLLPQRIGLLAVGVIAGVASGLLQTSPTKRWRDLSKIVRGRSLRITVRNTDSVTIVDLNGRITQGADCYVLTDTVNRLLAENRKKILLNMADVSDIDGAGVGTLVAAFTRASAQGGQLKLVTLTKKVREMVKDVLAHDFLEIFMSDTEAQTWLK